MNRILIMHGPNLNLTGIREPAHYGVKTFDEMNREFISFAESQGLDCDIFQSNHEGELIDKLHQCIGQYSGIVLNAGAFTHYSYAIRDAISAIGIPVVEVHMSNVHKREEFRHKSVISPVCSGVICGFGANSYILGIMALKEMF